MKPFIIVIQLAIIIYSISFAKADLTTGTTELKYDKGIISGLPKNYHPASFDEKLLIINIAGKKIIFPTVLKDLLTDNPFPYDQHEEHPKMLPFNIEFFAFLDHQDRAKDTYSQMIMTLTPKDNKYSIRLLFNIDKPQLILANVYVPDLGLIPMKLKH